MKYMLSWTITKWFSVSQDIILHIKIDHVLWAKFPKEFNKCSFIEGILNLGTIKLKLHNNLKNIDRDKSVLVN